MQLHSLEGPTLAAAAERWEARTGSRDGITANVQTTLYAAHKGRIKVIMREGLDPSVWVWAPWGNHCPATGTSPARVCQS